MRLSALKERIPLPGFRIMFQPEGSGNRMHVAKKEEIVSLSLSSFRAGKWVTNLRAPPSALVQQTNHYILPPFLLLCPKERDAFLDAAVIVVLQ